MTADELPHPLGDRNADGAWSTFFEGTATKIQSGKCRMSVEIARLAIPLLDIEPRLRRVRGYRHLPMLRDALKRELKIHPTTSKEKAA